ncbi:MAG: efflux RND transporter periplasmic adaptor subunit [Simkaniaceae bacterium]|nr:efflux RND transporter periplasmic adaptor subunit [Simkaniaceae bacterium]MCF7852383.1 efflux RND transporter periplasmic adaptor subunit [Simkaniaceae bacterium]
MKNLKLFIICLLSIYFTACHKKQQPQKFEVPISAMKVVAQTIPADFEFVGVAKSSHIVELRARVEGYLEQISYEEGGLVQANDLMFVVDPRPFIAAVEEAKGQLAYQEALLWNTQQSKNRMIPLYEQNAVSQKDLDDAIASEKEAEASVLSAQANLLKANLNLSFASIRAPVTAMASQAKFREGALIAPGPDSLLTTLYVIDPIWVNFAVSEGDILKAREEMLKKRLKYPEGMNFKIEIMMADNSILPAEGKIDFTDPALQQSTGTMLVRSILPNPKGWLKPGQFVRVIVKGATRPNAIIVPQSAVQQGQKGVFVYVIDKNNQAQIRPVSAGDWYKNYWIINEGLQNGDIVVGQGVNKVQNGTPVKIVQWMPSSPSNEQSPPSSLGNFVQ